MSAQNKGIIFTVLSAVCFATGGLLIKLNTMSSMSINGLRSFLAFFVFVGYMVYTRHAIRFNWQVLIGVVANSLMNITFIMANKLTTAANAIILQFYFANLHHFAHVGISKEKTGSGVCPCISAILCGNSVFLF